MTQVADPGPVADAAASASGPDDARPDMLAQLRALYADGRALIDAELGFQKARIAAAGRQVRTMAVLAIVGLVLVSCALIALVVGTMIALIPLLGAWGAMAATVAGSLVLAILCFWLAAGRVSRVGALFADDPKAVPDGPLPAAAGADA